MTTAAEDRLCSERYHLHGRTVRVRLGAEAHAVRIRTMSTLGRWGQPDRVSASVWS